MIEHEADFVIERSKEQIDATKGRKEERTKIQYSPSRRENDAKAQPPCDETPTGSLIDSTLQKVRRCSPRRHHKVAMR